MASKEMLATFFAPTDSVSAYNSSFASAPTSFNYATRSTHSSINSPTTATHICCAPQASTPTPSEEDFLVTGPSSSPSSSTTTSSAGTYVVNFNGTDYACTSPLGKFLYYTCGRLIRRAIHNPLLFASKMTLSGVIFFGCWYTMHFGGAIATWKFPRMTQHEYAEPLPDLVMDWFGPPADLPYCGHRDDWWFPGADMALALNLFMTLLEAFTGNHGHIHFQRAVHMSALVFLCRTTVVGLTGLNQPNERCLVIQDEHMTYAEAMKYVFSTFPHRSCGDLIYSGHTALLVIWMINMRWQNGIVHNRWYLTLWCWLQSGWGISLLIVCRSHYTVDVALGFYFAFFVSQFYMVRALNIFEGGSFMGRLIQRLEHWGEDWEKAGRLPGEVDDDEEAYGAKKKKEDDAGVPIGGAGDGRL